MYCPLVWHMCSVSDSEKVEKIQEKALGYVLSDFNDTYCNLAQRASKSTLYLSRLRILAIEIFKVLNDISTLCPSLTVPNLLPNEHELTI